jgi:hypothetical protein
MSLAKKVLGYQISARAWTAAVRCSFGNAMYTPGFQNGLYNTPKKMILRVSRCFIVST